MVLQMIWGFSTTMAWMGAQTSVSQLMRGSTGMRASLGIGPYGMLFGPPLAGWGWDTWGPWEEFIAISIWRWDCWFLLDHAQHQSDDRPPARRFRIDDLIPRRADYVSVLRMMTVPAIAICVYLSACASPATASRIVLYCLPEGNRDER